MKIIIDFDRVLFDHDAFKQAIDEHKQESLYAHPDIWDALRPQDFLYSDASVFLKQYQPSQLAIVSAYTARIGPHAEAYQQRKVYESGLQELVGEIIIMDGPKAPFVKERATERTYFIDDKRLYVEEVKRMCPEVTCVQLLRPGAERTKNDIESASSELSIDVVGNLAEVSAIIDRS